MVGESHMGDGKMPVCVWKMRTKRKRKKANVLWVHVESSSWSSSPYFASPRHNSSLFFTLLFLITSLPSSPLFHSSLQLIFLFALLFFLYVSSPLLAIPSLPFIFLFSL